MTSRRKLIGMLLGAALPAGCASMLEPSHHPKERAVLKPQRYCNGTVDAWGIVQDHIVKVIKCFSVVIAGSWSAITDMLDDAFSYADGNQQRRILTITDAGRERYLGTAGNVVGKATWAAAGNTLRRTGTFVLPVDGKAPSGAFRRRDDPDR